MQNHEQPQRLSVCIILSLLPLAFALVGNIAASASAPASGAKPAATFTTPYRTILSSSDKASATLSESVVAHA